MTRRIGRRLLPAALVVVVGAGGVAVPLAQAASQARRSLTVYAKPTRAQFISRSGDRKRTKINPFDAADIPTPKNANSGKQGARAGDHALFTLRLYSDARLTRPIGTASYACTVNFGQQAICEGQFSLNGGSMIALGPADLTQPHWVLPVTGGTNRYAGAHGQLTSRPAGGKNTQILRFQLV